ncbi:MAG: hypothetical protein MH252_07145 [Thermosynechococcaceae cyanobacterium MS004]|nr:hypothetical protein [Thermosynechococcaceae cyanobacterium MS004]
MLWLGAGAIAGLWLDGRWRVWDKRLAGAELVTLRKGRSQCASLAEAGRLFVCSSSVGDHSLLWAWLGGDHIALVWRKRGAGFSGA